MTINQLGINELTTEDQSTLLDTIRSCSDSMTRIAGEQTLIKEMTKKVAKDLGIPKPLINKMVKVYFKQNYDEEVAIQEQFESLYQTVVK